MAQTIIKQTQESLGKYVTKPPLTDKLLGKPPFRYLHDIINVVVKDHGFLRGLFTEEELSSDNIKDKEAKVAFLQKCIDATSMAVGEPLDVRPSKIVAGHEVENTNRLLQALAKGIDRKVNTEEIVKEVLTKSPAPKDRNAVESKKPKSKEKNGSSQLNGVVNPPKAPDPAPVKKSSPNQNNQKSKPVDKTKENAQKEKKAIKPKDQKPTKEKKEIPKGKPSEPKEEKRNVTKSRPERDKKEAPKTKTVPRTKPQPKESLPAKDRKTSKENANKKIPPKTQSKPSKVENKPKKVKSGETIATDYSSDVIRPETDGPPSLMAINGTSGDDVTLVQQPSDEKIPNGFEDSEKIHSGSHSDVDPAILKAMNRDDIDIMGRDPFDRTKPAEPSDSGVGSLESPKNNAGKTESLPNTADSRAPQNSESSTAVPRPSTLKSYHPDLDEDKATNDTPKKEIETESRPKSGVGVRPRTGRRSARPPSARPAPPKVRDRKDVQEEEITRPPTGKPVANVILDFESKENEDAQIADDDEFTVGSSTLLSKEPEDLETTSGNVIDANLERNKQELLEGDRDAKGILVAQILETKKELEDNRKEAFSPETPGHRRVPLDQTLQGDAGRRKEKELIQKDVEKLTSSIQALTRSVNPLAKMLDYLQEDFDSMQKELESWRSENDSLNLSLNAENRLTEEQLEPLRVQLEEMDAAILEQHDRISITKTSISRNEEKIERLLAGIHNH